VVLIGVPSFQPYPVPPPPTPSTGGGAAKSPLLCILGAHFKLSSDQNQSNTRLLPKSSFHLALPFLSFPCLAFPLLSIRFSTQPPSTALTKMPSSQIFTEILTNSTLNLPPRLRCDLYPSLLPRPIWSPHIKFRHQNAPSCRFSVHGLFAQFPTVRLFQGASL